MTTSDPLDKFTRAAENAGYHVSMVDVGGPFIENCTLRRASFEWKCKVCRRTIVNGDMYVEYTGESAPFHSGDRYCLLCANTHLKDSE